MSLSLADRGYYYDERIAEAAVERMSRYRYQSRDGWLADFWADGMTRPLYGWRRPGGSRRFRRFLATCGRKNAKSFNVAIHCLDQLFFDDDRFPEVILAGSDVDEADRVYSIVEGMVLETPQLDRFSRVTASRKRIDILMADKTGAIARKGVIRVISSKPKHGLNPSVVVMDELHKWPKDRRLFNALNTGKGARKSPLRIIISTMPEESGGQNLMEEQVEYVEKVLSGEIDDPSTGGCLWYPSQDDDPHDEATWRKGNPGLGTVKSLDTMREDYNEAKHIPALFNVFRQLELNQKVDRQQAAIPKEQWDACQKHFEVDPGADVIVGIDLSSTLDLTAAASIYPQPSGIWQVRFDAWTPAGTMRAREQKDMVPYSQWVRDGWLHTMPGRAINQNVVKAWLVDLRERQNVKYVSCDPWNAAQFMQDLANDGFETNQIRQGYRSMNAPCKELIRRIAEGEIEFESSPVADWMRANLIFIPDEAGNLKPDRRREREKIDLFAALLNAVDVAMRVCPKPEAPKKSVYNRKAPLVLSA